LPASADDRGCEAIFCFLFSTKEEASLTLQPFQLKKNTNFNEKDLRDAGASAIIIICIFVIIIIISCCANDERRKCAAIVGLLLALCQQNRETCRPQVSPKSR
jgi:hypothetical protein